MTSWCTVKGGVILGNVLRRLRAAGLQPSLCKCEFGPTTTQRLGHIVTREGILPDPNTAILQCLTPRSYGIYTPHVAHLAAPLYRLYRKGVQYTRSLECQQAFEDIQDILVSLALLRRVDPDLPTYPIQAG